MIEADRCAAAVGAANSEESHAGKKTSPLIRGIAVFNVNAVTMLLVLQLAWHVCSPWMIAILSSLLGITIIMMASVLRHEHTNAAARMTPRDRIFRFESLRRPVATQCFIALTFLAFFVARIIDPNWTLMRFGKVNDDIQAGEWWRLVTAMFMHASILHICFNMFALALFGRMIETVFGAWRFTTVYLVGGSMGFIASVAMTPSPSVGASGGVFALLGCAFVFGFRFRDALPPMMRKQYYAQTAWMIAINLALGCMVSQVDNAAHLGGVGAGMATALFMTPRDAVLGILNRGNEPMVGHPATLPNGTPFGTP
jgi:membrane associated rhomboid family serine protease